MDTQLLTQLRNPDPTQRRQAIIAAGNAMNPGALAALTYLAQHDPVDELRALAGKAAHHIQQAQPLETPNPDLALARRGVVHTEPIGVSSSMATPQHVTTGATWTCRFCGTTGIHGEICPNCGAPRDSEQVIESQAPIQSTAVSPSDLFLLNPANQDFIEGKTRSLASAAVGVSSGCLILFLVPFVIAGLLMIGLTVNEWNNYQQLSRNGATVIATVVDRYESSDSDNSTTYHLRYRFTLDAHTYTNSQSVDWNQYDTFPVGKTLTIVYARNNPGIAQIGTQANMNTALFLTVFTIIWDGVILVIFFALIWRSMTTNQLVRHGKVLVGQITACDGYNVTNRYSQYTVRVNYSFHNPQSKQLSGTNRLARNDLNANLLPQPGTPVAVLYADDQTFRLL